MKSTLADIRERFAPHSRWGAVGIAPRRTNRGTTTEATNLHQPQDGVSDVPSSVAALPSVMLRGPYAAAFAKLNEPEDASLTGATRSLGRRLLGLNIAAMPVQAIRQGLLPQRAPALTRTQVA